MGIYTPGSESNHVLTICELGYGKQTTIEDFPLQNRSGKGVILIQTSERNGPAVGLGMVAPEDEIIVITDRGVTLRTAVAGIRTTGRNAQGVAIMNVAEDERISAVEIFTDDGEGDDEDLVDGELADGELADGELADGESGSEAPEANAGADGASDGAGEGDGPDGASEGDGAAGASEGDGPGGDDAG